MKRLRQVVHEGGLSPFKPRVRRELCEPARDVQADGERHVVGQRVGTEMVHQPDDRGVQKAGGRLHLDEADGVKNGCDIGKRHASGKLHETAEREGGRKNDWDEYDVNHLIAPLVVVRPVKREGFSKVEVIPE